MKASEKSLTFLKEQVTYLVPYFQRGYVWDESNWDGIWEELSAEGSTGFLGSIILKEENSPHNEEMRKTIIDGQQRLTTLTILLRAMHDYYTAKGVSDLNTLQHFKELIIYASTQWLEAGIITTEKCRIEHSRLNRDDYEKVILGKVSEDSIIMDSRQKGF